MSEAKTFELHVRLLEKYRFEVDFGEFGKIETDEPAPLGDGNGPNPARVLAAAVGNCLAASMVFAIRKFKEDPGAVSANVQVTIDREGKFWRIVKLQVTLELGNRAAAMPHLARALAQFEDFCIVTQSVRQGIPVEVAVRDLDGTTLPVGG